ncbi:MAG: hypothetical protein CL679_06510 [Bermanella sp.]|nr:hypothetical protein [Bermanella sp.]
MIEAELVYVAGLDKIGQDYRDNLEILIRIINKKLRYISQFGNGTACEEIIGPKPYDIMRA